MEFKITLPIVSSFKEFHCEHISELIFSVLHMHIIYTCITYAHIYLYAAYNTYMYSFISFSLVYQRMFQDLLLCVCDLVSDI